MDSRINSKSLKALIFIIYLIFILSSFSFSKVFAALVRSTSGKFDIEYKPSGLAKTSLTSKKFTITKSGLRSISNIQGSFYPYNAQGKWVVVVGEPESLYIGKPTEDYHDKVIPYPDVKAVVWLGVLNPVLAGKRQSNAFLGISFSPAYSVYGESITSQLYNSKSAIDYLLTTVDVGVMLLSIGAASEAKAGSAGGKSLAERFKIAEKIQNYLNSFLEKLRLTSEHKAGRFALRVWNTWVNFFKASSKKAMAAKLALYSGGYEAYKHFAQPELLRIAGSQIHQVLNLSLFTYVDYDHPAVLGSNIIYHASSNSKIPFLGSKKEKLKLGTLEAEPGKLVRIVNEYLIHIPGLEDRVSKLFRSAGPRYTLVYTFDSGNLSLSYRLVPRLSFTGTNINIISRSTFSSYLTDASFANFLVNISKGIKSKYGLNVNPVVLGKYFYTAPVELPNSYFYQFTDGGASKVTQILEKHPEMTPAEAIYYAGLDKNDFLSHEPSTWKRILYGVGAGASYGGAIALGAAGISTLLAAGTVAAAATGVGLIVIAAGLVVAGTYFAKSGISSWEISNMVFVPSSSTGTDYTRGDKIASRAAIVCYHVYALIQKIKGKVNASEVMQKCSNFGNNVKNSIAGLVDRISNSPIAPLIEALHIDLKGLHDSLSKESLPLTLDWYYYYPADVIYVPKVYKANIYIYCIDNTSCLKAYQQGIEKLMKIQKESKKEESESEEYEDWWDVDIPPISAP
jgi:hypothetical protein